MRQDGDTLMAWVSSQKVSPRCPPFADRCDERSAASFHHPDREGPEAVIRQNLRAGLPIMEHMGQRVIRETRRWQGYGPQAEEFWGRGFASEFAGAFVCYGLETLGMRQMRASHDSANIASARVLKKLDLTLESEETIHGVWAAFYHRSHFAVH